MKSYLYIGGAMDGLDVPALDRSESVELPISVIDRETYIRTTLTVGDVFIVFYRHESLTPEQVLDRIVAHYKAWAVNRPGGHLTRR